MLLIFWQQSYPVDMRAVFVASLRFGEVEEKGDKWERGWAEGNGGEGFTQFLPPFSWRCASVLIHHNFHHRHFLLFIFYRSVITCVASPATANRNLRRLWSHKRCRPLQIHLTRAVNLTLTLNFNPDLMLQRLAVFSRDTDVSILRWKGYFLTKPLGPFLSFMSCNGYRFFSLPLVHVFFICCRSFSLALYFFFSSPIR